MITGRVLSAAIEFQNDGDEDRAKMTLRSGILTLLSLVLIPSVNSTAANPAQKHGFRANSAPRGAPAGLWRTAGASLARRQRARFEKP